MRNAIVSCFILITHISSAQENRISAFMIDYAFQVPLVDLAERFGNNSSIGVSYFFEKENGIFYEPSDVLVSNGEKQSLYTACQAIFNPDDSVVVFSPYWVSFPEFVKMADAKPIIVNGSPANME